MHFKNYKKEMRERKLIINSEITCGKYVDKKVHPCYYPRWLYTQFYNSAKMRLRQLYAQINYTIGKGTKVWYDKLDRIACLQNIGQWTGNNPSLKVTRHNKALFRTGINWTLSSINCFGSFCHGPDPRNTNPKYYLFNSTLLTWLWQKLTFRICCAV